MIANKRLLFLLADENGLIYYKENGVIKKSALKKWLKKNPNGWKDITLQWATNEKYFSTIRAFSTALKFVEDGKDIILDRLIKGKGTEEVMYLIILRQDPSGGLNYYKFEYKSRLDFSKAEPDVRTGLSVNMLQDDVFSLVQADENNKYSIPCNASNPAAIKVLFDGVLMQDKLNYQTINAPLTFTTSPNNYFAIPLVFLNNEGDSVGTVFNSQNYDNFSNPNTYISGGSNTNCIVYYNAPTAVTIKGSFVFTWSTNTLPSGSVVLFFMTSLQTLPVPGKQIIFSNTGPHFDLVPGKTYSIDINLSISLAAGEKLFFFANLTDNAARHFTITPQPTKISVMFATKQSPSIAFGVRPLDLLQQLVSKITNGKYTANSKFFTNNNRKVILSGSSLRGFTDAQIQTSFADWFQSYTSAYNLGVTVRGGVLWVEPVEDIYNSNRQLLDLGEVSNYKLTVAEQFIYTSAKFGYQKQNYNKRNGRYEFNCIHNYKFPVYTVLNQLNRVSVYHAAPFIMEFIRMDLQNLNSTDDKGDNEVFTAMISDAVGQTDGNVSTAVSFTVETLVIATPIIKSPYSGATVYNSQPTITGIAQANMTITVYVDGVIDGTTTSDLNGNWAYQVQQQLQSLSVNYNGVHRIETTASAGPGVNSGFSKELSITVDTQSTSAFIITGPTNNDTLYNNLPFITGTAPAGSQVTILIDGAITITVPTNTSSLWGYQVTAPLNDGTHLIFCTSPGLPNTPAYNFTVNRNVSSPLITSIIYGDVIFNNLPTIKGVAQAGVTVSVYLDGGGGPTVGGVRGPLGTAIADGNGDWSFHVTSVVDASGITTNYIPDGQHIISTTPTPVNVLAAISGYKLMRGSNKGPVMDYDVIKLDDEYIPPGIDPSSLPPTLGQFLHPETLFNIEETTPLRMLRAHDNILKSFLIQQPGEKVTFNGAELNANLVTKKNGVVFNEGADIPVPDLKNNLYLNFFLNFKSKVPFTFNEIMTGINNDGYITVSCKGIPVYCLPVGSMSMKLATNEAQNWKLLVSGKTPFDSLIKIFSDVTVINIGKNMMYLSDKNPLHFVKYNFTPPAGYHIADLYDDWQKNRFPTWAVQPDYVQPVQKGDPLPLQFVTNGVSGLQLLMVSCTTGNTVDTIAFNPVPGLVVPLPMIMQEAFVNTNSYPEDQYWYALVANSAIVAITEKIDLRTDWPDTLKIEYGGSKDAIDYYFSTGIQPMIRVQGQLLPWQQGAEVDIYESEEGDYEITRGIPTDFREIQFGNQFSLISDWMARKLNSITLLSNWRVEGTQYTRFSDSKWDKQDFGVGIPEVMVKMAITLADHQLGVNISTPGDSGVHTTSWVLDATAFGQNAGVINVTAEP